MNWTGGAFRRSKNAKSSVSMTQKRNFAKTKAKLLNGPKSPYKHDFSMFEPGAKFTFNDHNRARKEHDENHDLKDSLGIDDNHASVVDFPISIKPRHQSRERTVTNLEKSQYSSQMRGRARSILSSTIKNHNLNVTSPSSCKTHKARHEKYKKRAKLSEAEQLEAMRQQLLSTDDWCGLRRTAPTKMQLMDGAERDMIGNRRVIGKTNHNPPRSQIRKNSRIGIDEHGNGESSFDRTPRRSIIGRVENNSSSLSRGQNTFDLNSDEMLFNDDIVSICHEQDETIDEGDPREGTQLQSISFPVDGVPGLRLVFDYPPEDALSYIKSVEKKRTSQEVDGILPYGVNAIENKKAPQEINSTIITNDALRKTQQDNESLPLEKAEVLMSQAPISTVEPPQKISEVEPAFFEDEERIWRKFVFADEEDEESHTAGNAYLHPPTKR